MRDTLAPLLAMTLLTFGAVLLDGSASKSDSSQATKLIGGAAIFSTGLLSLGFALKNRLKWRRFTKD